VPNLLGMYMRDADHTITRLGLKSSGSIVVTTQAGSGDVFQQSPPSGVVVPPGTTVTILIARNPNDE
jgi:beta-lactam-binding protein with PASTA domain